MTTFMSKLRTATLGTVHDLLDKAIDANSPSFLRQYVRDLEAALDQMRNQAAVQAGQVRTQQREITTLKDTIDIKTKQTQTSLQQDRKDLARIQAGEVVRLQKQLEQMNTDLESQKQNTEAIDKSVVLLEEKHSQMMARLHELERLDRDSKTKEQAATALAGAGKLVEGGADMSVDDIESKMRARNDIASEKFDRAMGSTSFKTEENPETTEAVDSLLAELGQHKEQKTA